jgi:hypothetical protein
MMAEWLYLIPVMVLNLGAGLALLLGFRIRNGQRTMHTPVSRFIGWILIGTSLSGIIGFVDTDSAGVIAAMQFIMLLILLRVSRSILSKEQTGSEESRTDSDYVICHNCGFEQWKGNVYCQKCTAPLRTPLPAEAAASGRVVPRPSKKDTEEVICPRCNFEQWNGSRECQKCGVKFA